MTRLKQHLYSLLFALLTFSVYLHAEPLKEPPAQSKLLSGDPANGYTVNFNNISIVECLKFISQVGNVNFMYQEEELKFNVSIVSEGPARLIDIMTALMQVLKVNGFELIEQENNFIVTKSGATSQIATVFSENQPPQEGLILPIMTYVFKVENANPSKLKSILTPFLSPDSIIEVSEETRHLVITDITQNIEQIQRLMSTLDAPNAPLEVGSYLTKHNSPEELIPLAQQIIMPLSEGNPLILVPQDKTQMIFIVSTSFLTERTLSILEDLDTLPSITSTFDGVLTGSNLLLYHIKHKPVAMLESALNQISTDFSKAPNASKRLIEAFNSMKYIRSSHSLLFIGAPEALEEINKILTDIDLPYTDNELTSMHQGFYIYKIKNGTEEQIKQSLDKLVENLQQTSTGNEDLISAIQSMRWIKGNNSLLFLGDERSLETISKMLPTFDIPIHEGKTSSRLPLSNDFFIYKPKNMSGEQFLAQVQKVDKDLELSGLADPALLHALQSAKMSTNGAVIFTGDAESLDRIRALVTLIDDEAAHTKAQSSVYIYKVQYSDYTYVKEELDKLASSLPKDSDLRKTIEGADYLKASNSFFFRGSPTAIDKIKEILTTLDNPESVREKANEFFVYQPSHLPAEELIVLVHNMAENMQESGFTDSFLLTTLSTARLTGDKKGILFVGSGVSINRIKELLPTIDTASSNRISPKEERNEFFVYHPAHKPPEELLSLVHNMATDMQSSGLANSNLIYTLQSAQLTANQKAVLFTGTSDSIAEVKNLLPVIDISTVTTKKPQNTGFFVYQPIHISAEAIQKGAVELAKDMQVSGFADEELINTLQNAQITSNGKAVLFTGSPSTIERLKNLLPKLDITPSTSETTLFIYKLKHLSGPALMEDLRHSTKDLPINTQSSQELIATINSMRFIETTNSIVFNGPPQAIERIKAIISQFDVASAVPPSPARAASGYKIYKPQNAPGEQLIRMLREFEKNLINSGVSQQSLFDVINHLQWMPATSSILISGDAKSVDEVYSLLERFDNLEPRISENQSDIEQFADMSFLIYKLEYHSGQEIVSALSKIGQDLEKVSTDSNKKLFSAIKALQWIEITNSLISTGDPDTLAKLRQLIESIDVPLKQVFVEVLVLETTLGNALNFGLRWGSKGKYRNRFAYATGSFPQNSENNPDTLRDFQNNLGTVSATTTPTGSFIPFTTGFDLGVIGDIILHKGQTYFSLGSLVDAIKVEGDSTVVINQKLVTQDNKNSTLFVGNNVPYTGSFVTNTNQNTVQTANLEYRDIGVNLSITPKIGNNDIITLDIEQDITELINPDIGSTTSSDNITGITTSKTSSRTVVSVPDQSFLVLSGQIQNTKTHARTGIPCLGGIPLIGAFFSENDYQKNITNLIIFVRPHIIKTFDEYKEITERQETVYRSQTDDPESFDAALELVKTPDDF
ncbi:MAG: secretin N-terminal domain-containing protein [Chlamydiota bacterium]